MNELNNVVGKEGVNINVSVDTQSVLYIAAGVFFAVVLGGIMIHVITKNI